METEIKGLPEMKLQTFKLIKNTRGYTWEIKSTAETLEECLDLAEKANNEAIKRFNSYPIAKIKEDEDDIKM